MESELALGYYIHLKTGNKYKVIGTAINSTNAQDGEVMVIYYRNGMYFARELSEFLQKLKKD